MTNAKKIPAAISVDWWFGELELAGEQEFKSELSESYTLSIVRARRGPLGGGLYQLCVEFLSQLSFKEVVDLILGGVAYDLIKSGAISLLLRPFLNAYNRFKSHNNSVRVDIDKIRFAFQDATIIIERLPRTDVLAELERILVTVAQNFEVLTVRSKGRLFEVHVPVFEDFSEDRVSRFRALLSVDETIDTNQISNADYFKYWGLEYYSAFWPPSCVYDVQARRIIDEPFYTETQYWTAKRARRVAQS